MSHTQKETLIEAYVSLFTFLINTIIPLRFTEHRYILLLVHSSRTEPLFRVPWQEHCKLGSELYCVVSKCMYVRI